MSKDTISKMRYCFRIKNNGKNCDSCYNRFICAREENTFNANQNTISIDNETEQQIENRVYSMKMAGIGSWDTEDMLNICYEANLYEQYIEEFDELESIKLTLKAGAMLGYNMSDFPKETRKSYKAPEQVYLNGHEFTEKNAEGRIFCKKCGLYKDYAYKRCIS